jgi:hypothetical protein
MGTVSESGGTAAANSATPPSENPPTRDYVLTEGPTDQPPAEPQAPAAAAPEGQPKDGGEGKEPPKEGTPDTGGDESQRKADADKPKPRRGGFQRKLDRAEQSWETVYELATKAGVEIPETLRPQRTLQQAQQPQAPQPEPEPKEEDFENYSDFVGAKARWQAVQVHAEARLKDQQEAVAQAQVQEFNSRVERYMALADEFKKEHPDFDEVTGAEADPLSPFLRVAILESEIPAHVTYHLAKNPELYGRLNGMSDVVGLNREIGRLEAKLESQAPSDPATGGETQQRQAERKTTSAPPPITPVKSTGSNVKDDGDMDYDTEYRPKRFGSGKA